MHRDTDSGAKLVGLGLRDLLVVATGDALLVANRSHAQNVKDVVTTLRAKEFRVADTFPGGHRPWGHFERKCIRHAVLRQTHFGKPSGILPLQSHHHGAEHRIVVEGTARVTTDDTVPPFSENQSIYVPMVLIEVQTGSYLGEADIER